MNLDALTPDAETEISTARERQSGGRKQYAEEHRDALRKHGLLELSDEQLMQVKDAFYEFSHNQFFGMQDGELLTITQGIAPPSPPGPENPEAAAAVGLQLLEWHSLVQPIVISLLPLYQRESATNDDRWSASDYAAVEPTGALTEKERRRAQTNANTFDANVVHADAQVTLRNALTAAAKTPQGIAILKLRDLIEKKLIDANRK